MKIIDEEYVFFSNISIQYKMQYSRNKTPILSDDRVSEVEQFSSYNNSEWYFRYISFKELLEEGS